jgi:hypothetical protein
MRTSIVLGLSLALGSACSDHGSHAAGTGEGAPSAPGTTVLGFDAGAAGALPAGWRAAGTKQEGPLATWAVVADPTAPSPPNVLALTASSHGSSGTFNLCWTDAVRFGDGTIELAFRADGGEEDQGGGPIWRVRDADDYYVCRANPLESNFRVYYVKDGERKQLASTQVELASGTWHRIRVEHTGRDIVCTLDGEHRLAVSDDHLSEPGGVGVWTKADAATSFDELSVTASP